MLMYPYQLILSKRRRSVQISVKAGQVRVTAPVDICRIWLEQWLAKKACWVQQHICLTSKDSPVDYLTLKTLLISGEEVSFSWQLGPASKCWLNENGLILQLSTRIKAENQPHYANRLLRDFFSQQAQTYFTAQVTTVGQLMAVKPLGVVIGDWRRRWGYCDSSKTLGFNWRLMQAPEWVRFYVIVHELAHLTYMNHSTLFWQRVKTFCPEYLLAKEWLKQHQSQLLLS